MYLRPGPLMMTNMDRKTIGLLAGLLIVGITFLLPLFVFPPPPVADANPVEVEIVDALPVGTSAPVGEVVIEGVTMTCLHRLGYSTSVVNQFVYEPWICQIGGIDEVFGEPMVPTVATAAVPAAVIPNFTG